jgi:Cytochrome P450
MPNVSQISPSIYSQLRPIRSIPDCRSNRVRRRRRWRAACPMRSTCRPSPRFPRRYRSSWHKLGWPCCVIRWRQPHCARPELWPTAMEELLRYAGPSQALSRYAVQDIELRGRRIRRGQRGDSDACRGQPRSGAISTAWEPGPPAQPESSSGIWRRRACLRGSRAGPYGGCGGDARIPRILRLRQASGGCRAAGSPVDIPVKTRYSYFHSMFIEP